jgi:hypothetical protein
VLVASFSNCGSIFEFTKAHNSLDIIGVTQELKFEKLGFCCSTITVQILISERRNLTGWAFAKYQIYSFDQILIPTI